MSKNGTGPLQALLDKGISEHRVPGVAVGIYDQGEEHYYVAGVTSIENPLPVDDHTLFQTGSTGKTYTATAIMRLVEKGKLALDDKVKKHVPELRLQDKAAERGATILHLLNHTAGWAGDQYDSTGEGDDALAKLVTAMAGFEQRFPLGTRHSYNNVSLSLAGRVIEKVTGKTFEQAMRELFLDPLGMTESFYFLNEVATRRFAVGHHNRDERVEVARPLHMSRNGNPAGGLSSTVRDQIKYARFHLGDGRNAEGKRVLKQSTLRLMRKPTVRVPRPGSPEYCGISWFLNDHDGVQVVSHGGNVIGQNHAFHLVPERDFAISVMTNSSPGGSRLEGEIVKWAFKEYAGIGEPAEPAPLDLTAAQLREYAGTYATDAVILKVKVDGDHLVVQSKLRPATLKALVAEGEDPPEAPPFPVKITPGDGGLVIDGPGKGMQFLFARGSDGKIDGIELGRFAAKEK
ncbi:MAG TPA: serine hydrolase domain-containing protein [Solirubrobacterales bacterium]|nr:serine hydrolase domain-containing protein [Solirubrobacterales bacterium]